MGSLTEEDECVIVFDAFVCDIAQRDHGVDCEDFKALIRKHGLVTSDSLKSHFSGIVDKLWQINEGVMAKRDRN